MSEISAVPATPPVKRREIFGWCCFDFANSAFTTIIITVVYAVYFQKVVAGGHPHAAGWWGTTLSLSQVGVLLLSPLIGAIADVRASKKRYLLLTSALCSAATVALYFVGDGEVALALALVFVANLAFSLSENLCAAFLPEISTAQNVGRISGYGWSFGYFGGLLSLVLALVIIKKGPGVSWTFVMTGLFFILAIVPTMLLLRERARPRVLRAGETYAGLAWGQLAQMRHELPQHRTLAIFFVAMTIYISGLMAVISFSSLYASNVLAMTEEELIALFALLQIAGVAGAFACGFLQDRVGSKASLLVSLALWVIVCVWAAACRTKTEFYYIGGLAGLAIGALQSAGRALVARLTPPGRAGEFFGYWGFFGKLAGVIGQFVFGWAAAAAGYRTAILLNSLFFFVGLVIVWRLRLPPRAALAAVGDTKN